MKDIPIERARALLNYCPVTGRFTWQKRVEENHFHRSWNAKYAGTDAGYIAPNGYRMIKFDGELYLAHRIAWALATGEQLTPMLDHADGNRSNNQLENLRAASRSQNGFNRKASLSRGVRQSGKRWRATIQVEGRKLNLGTFATRKEAQEAFNDAAKLHFGEFAA